MIRHLVNVVTSVLRERAKRKTRSPHWEAVERAFRKYNPACAACGGMTRLQVHHKQPFHLHPELELDPGNLIGLCFGPNECHLEIGHGGDWRGYNPNVVSDAAEAISRPAFFKDVVLKARLARKF